MGIETPRRAFWTLADLQRAGAFIDTTAKRRRGRPKHVSLGQMETSRSGAWAVEVFRQMYLLGGMRGSQAAAIAKVARREPGYSRALRSSIENRIKQAVKRHPEAKSFGSGLASFQMMAEELARRTLGFPDDVKAMIYDWPAVDLLDLLRAENIDGNCPEELIALARRRARLNVPKR